MILGKFKKTTELSGTNQIEPDYEIQETVGSVALLTPIILLSQNAFYQVVTTKYDTLKGILIEQDNRLTLAVHPNQHRVSFQPKEILEYAVLHSDKEKEHYQFITIPGTKKLKPMRRVVNGELKLYVDKVEYTSKVNKGLPKGPTLVPKVDVFYIAHYSEDAEEVTRFNWKEVLPQAACRMSSSG
ncbi:MAG: hypothetical protein IPJ74_12715 [Saprospiraceae bacterium]|nr:hypothetical protein [Saprospiraceae bacterium]